MVPPFDLPEFSLKLPDVLGSAISFPDKVVDEMIEPFYFHLVDHDIPVDLDALFKAHGAPTKQRRRVS